MADDYPIKFHKRIRLDREEYSQPGSICSITAACLGRRTVFSDERVASRAVEILQARVELTKVVLYAYCIMPDHLHLVLETSSSCDIMSFVGQYKNLCQRGAWELGVVGRIWQTSLWDHLLRADEQLERVVEYVLGNPVRKGLVNNWRDYPSSGSPVFEL